uniref:Uncharacterized protein n=1 Tax=Lactuca sativa TaxID=4236 RepID=A0A9R1W215_LACSA|nr:hypothetical protein LSAT_V11C300135840 [Lactuca sativa]
MIFTWVHSLGAKLSKLDKFFVLKEMYEQFEQLHFRVLDRKWSNHYPILLHDLFVYYGLSFLTLGSKWMGLMIWSEMRWMICCKSGLELVCSF